MPAVNRGSHCGFGFCQYEYLFPDPFGRFSLGHVGALAPTPSPDRRHIAFLWQRLSYMATTIST